jgi:hypothetical protein
VTTTDDSAAQRRHDAAQEVFVIVGRLRLMSEQLQDAVARIDGLVDKDEAGPLP